MATDNDLGDWSVLLGPSVQAQDEPGGRVPAEFVDGFGVEEDDPAEGVKGDARVRQE